MTERERLIGELENYEPYAVHFPHLTIDGKLILDVLNFLREQPEIVRCKDCKHYKDGTGMCALYHAHGCAETWFCADGERR